MSEREQDLDQPFELVSSSGPDELHSCEEPLTTESSLLSFYEAIDLGSEVGQNRKGEINFPKMIFKVTTSDPNPQKIHKNPSN